MANLTYRKAANVQRCQHAMARQAPSLATQAGMIHANAKVHFRVTAIRAGAVIHDEQQHR